MAPMTPEKLRSDIAATVLASLPDVRWLALLGSHARGDATQESDVDVALLAGASIERGSVHGR